MFKKKNSSTFVIIALFLIVMISVGYAALGTTLNINGTTDFAKHTWDIRLENLKITEGSEEATAPATIDQTSTSVNFNVNLKVPGDYYEFIVDVVNKGSIDAKLSEVQTKGIPDGQEKFFKYTVGYIDGKEIKTNDKLAVNAKETIIVRVEYRNDLQNNETLQADQNLNLSLVMLYVQDDENSNVRLQNLIDVIKEDAVMDNVASEFVSSDTGIVFSSIPSEKNGKGLYIRSGTEKEDNPIYYYRGDVKDNNVLFANFCWKIVRTTETGGVKLIYNGTPTNGECNGTDPTIGQSEFNKDLVSEQDTGYIYADGTNSTIKGVIDTWYEKNMTSYTKKLEDTPWCNDRSVSSIKGGQTIYGAVTRLEVSAIPVFTCDEANKLTVSSTEKNKHLNYPIGILTADEGAFAGFVESYINVQEEWWTLTPLMYLNYGNAGTTITATVTEDDYNTVEVTQRLYVRPSVSLKPYTKLIRGDGTSKTPYIVE